MSDENDDVEISTALEAAREFSLTINQLMSGLLPIIKRNSPTGWELPNISSLLKSASNNSITEIFDNGLTAPQKFMLAQAWAKAMDPCYVINKFIDSTSKYWDQLDSEDQSVQEKAIFSVIEGLDIPHNGSDFLKSLYDKKNLLSDKEKKVILNYFQACAYYGKMYQSLVEEGKN